ncbi:dehydrase and lipid transport-domain-containing protein [Clohesyomyces aquaticus]|uniref:Dehydrase and lipid transport-domain-containing protein n=1 Tax=Clohesyomyces aquaticus TaxID=1231657 RepID=A0A1Y1YEQ6_9PLEO|nr:dehydrase and lipid transport-domain-containing protein [Clohesyomyces aquaticus]
MASTKTLRPLLRDRTQFLRPQRRTFFPNPFDIPNPLASTSQSGHQTLTATRTLPYPPAPIYNIISDVPSYSSFLPYCQSSAVTKWSSPDATFHRCWPSEAQITVGWGGITESFISRIFCVPGRIVESVGGATESALNRDDITHHLDDKSGGNGTRSAQDGLLTHLRSRWTINPVPADSGKESEKTEVKLSLEFAFSNPMYSAVSAGVAPKVAEVMIKAFEERVNNLLIKRPDLVKASLADLDQTR